MTCGDTVMTSLQDRAVAGIEEECFKGGGDPANIRVEAYTSVLNY